MESYTGWERYEPSAIRKALPLEWAIGYLFDAWEVGAAMTPCPLPGHEDSTPSFNLWCDDDDGFPQRFGCFGCGANGDVVDAVRLARGVGFTAACTIAVDELVPALEESAWQPSDHVPVERGAPKSHDDLEAVYDRIVNYGDLDLFLARKYEIAGTTLERFGSYVYMAWRWGAFRTPAPTAYFPHLDWDRRFTGIRYRSIRKDSTRWTERGSRFPALYGAWRDQGRPAVLLCEGETDTAWAAYQMDRDARPFDVMGLPSGAAQKPPEGAIRRLLNRTTYLAFDADMAGRIATARWRTALGETLVVPIPDGHDVLSCNVPIEDLMKEAHT